MKGDPIMYTLQCMMGNSEFKQVLMLICDDALNVFTVLQNSVFVAAGFMQRSLSVKMLMLVSEKCVCRGFTPLKY